MSRTRFSKKSRRHTRRHTKRRTNKRRSRRFRKVGGAQGYSEEDKTFFKGYIEENILNGRKKAVLLDKLEIMPYEENYDYKFDIAGAEQGMRLQGKDRIDAFNKYSDQWW